MQSTKPTFLTWCLLIGVLLASPVLEYPDCWSPPPPPPPLDIGLPVAITAPAPAPSASQAPMVLDSGPGKATYYSPEVAAGSCGVVKQSTDMITAAPASLMAGVANPNLSPHCCGFSSRRGDGGSADARRPAGAVDDGAREPQCHGGDHGYVWGLCRSRCSQAVMCWC